MEQGPVKSMNCSVDCLPLWHARMALWTTHTRRTAQNPISYHDRVGNELHSELSTVNQWRILRHQLSEVGHLKLKCKCMTFSVDSGLPDNLVTHWWPKKKFGHRVKTFSHCQPPGCMENNLKMKLQPQKWTITRVKPIFRLRVMQIHYDKAITPCWHWMVAKLVCLASSAGALLCPLLHTFFWLILLPLHFDELVGAIERGNHQPRPQHDAASTCSQSSDERHS